MPELWSRMQTHADDEDRFDRNLARLLSHPLGFAIGVLSWAAGVQVVADAARGDWSPSAGPRSRGVETQPTWAAALCVNPRAVGPPQG